MSPSKKHVVFDVVGTCMSFDAIVDAIETRLGDKLRARHVTPHFFVFAWFEAAEREYTYLSISKRYRSFNDALTGLFFRILWMAGVEEPRSFATEDDLAFVMNRASRLTARPGIVECFSLLQNAGFTVWAFSMDTVELVDGYFKSNDIDFPRENILSCDTDGVGKPAPEAYQSVLKKFGGEEAWFAAAHMWDTTAAKSTG